MLPYVDVHAHLTHKDFDHDRNQVIADTLTKGMKAVIVNGLNPESNRQTLVLAKRWSHIKAALGIYPIEAVHHLVADKVPFKVAHFNLDDELTFIRQQAEAGHLIAIGECGLDGYWAGPETFSEQERIFSELTKIAIETQLPLIVHSRKCEERVKDLLSSFKAPKVIFHCFGGKAKWAAQWAEQFGWYFSIPANARRSESFTKMIKNLPGDLLLTETDCPYLGPEKGQRSDPTAVMTTVDYISELRGGSKEDACQMIYGNYLRLFGATGTKHPDQILR